MKRLYTRYSGTQFPAVVQRNARRQAHIASIYITSYIIGYMNRRGRESGSKMVEDVVKGLGYLALGTRLKRLGERLQAQTQVVLGAAAIDLPASHFPLLAALDRLGALNVGELTEALGMSQPGVTRLLDKLAADGLVRSTQSAADRRVRTVDLTKSGRQLVSRAKRSVWPVVEAAVADACTGSPGALLPILTALEQALDQSPLSARAERLKTGETQHAAT